MDPLLRDYLFGISGLVEHVRDYVGDFRGIDIGQQQVGSNWQMVALPDGRLAIHTGHTIVIMDPDTGEQGVTLPIRALNVGMFGDQLATSTHDLKWRTWDLNTGLCTSERVLSLASNQLFAFYRFCTLPNKNQVALFGNAETHVKVMDMSTGVHLYSLDKLQGTPRAAVCLSDGRLVVAVEHILHVHDDGQFVCKLENPYNVFVAKLEADASWLLAHTSDGVVIVWDISTLTCARVIPAVSHAVLLHGTLVTANNTQMDIYRLPHDLQPFKTVQLASYVSGLAVLPNCRLASSHSDGSLRLWR